VKHKKHKMASGRYSISSSSTKKNNTIKPIFTDDIFYIINNILNKANSKYAPSKAFINRKNEIYYIDSKSLEGIIYTLKHNLPKKSIFRSIKNSISSFRKTLTKKKNSRNNKLSGNTNTNTNKNSEPLIDFKTLISEIEKLLDDIKIGENIYKKELDSYLNNLAKYMNNSKYFNQIKFNNKQIKFIFIDEDKRLEIESKKTHHNAQLRVNSLNRQSMSVDLVRLQSQEAETNAETNKKNALTLVNSLNDYFESLGAKDYDTIINDLDIYAIQYQTFKSLLKGQLEPGESEEKLHRLYYELLYNINENNTEKIKDIKKINNIIDLILNVRLQLLKVKGGVFLTEKELNKRFELLKGKIMSEEELNKRFNKLKKN